MRGSYGNVGPLQMYVVKGSELLPGDVIIHNNHMKVVIRSYSHENVHQQALDVESGEQDRDGEWISPYRINVGMDEEFTVLRAPPASFSIHPHKVRRASKLGQRLFEVATYARTGRLLKLLDGEVNPTYHDIFELFNILRQSEGYCGVRPSLKDFAEWILNQLCEVTW